MEGPLHVRPPVLLRARDALRGGNPRGEMVHQVPPLHGLRDGLGREDGALAHADLPRTLLEVPNRARGQVVEDGDVVLLTQTLREMGAEEPRAPRDQDLPSVHGLARHGEGAP